MNQSKIGTQLGYFPVLSGVRTSRVQAFAFNFYLIGSCISARLTAVFFAGGNGTSTGDMRTGPLFNVVHLRLL